VHALEKKDALVVFNGSDISRRDLGAFVDLADEAHHMFVGETGVERIVQRTAELMKQDKNEDARAQGGIPLDMVQRYLNLWFALSLDLFGGEVSSNAASFFADGLKGRYKEESQPDHTALGQHYKMTVPKEGALVDEDVPLRNAMNEVLRDAYVDDCQRGVDRWNKRLAEAGVSGRLRLPSKRFYRHIGIYADMRFDMDGKPLSQEEWERGKGEWLPTDDDRAYVATLQKPVYEPGKIANWIGKPARGIKGLPFEYEYVRLD
jgi:benzoyl-CoA 2,3-dioxygenase component B